MKYNIISISDARESYKSKIREYVGFEEDRKPAFDSYQKDVIQGLDERGIKLVTHGWDNPKRGELGVWLSNYDCWNSMNEDLIVFEDDAIIGPEFKNDFDLLTADLPDNWDFIALWVPENQRVDYTYELTYDSNGVPNITGYRTESLFDCGLDRACLVYQGYGMVSLAYSVNGAKKLVDLVHRYGITGPVDCWIYEHAHKNNLNGFAPKPQYADIVSYDWSAVSHVQLTERAI